MATVGENYRIRGERYHRALRSRRDVSLFAETHSACRSALGIVVEYP